MEFRIRERKTVHAERAEDGDGERKIGSDDGIIRSLAAWTQLFGVVNFEVFGRLADIVGDVDAVFDQSVRHMLAFVGIHDKGSAVP